MGMKMPETCWAVFKRQVINFRSCCILLVDSAEMEQIRLSTLRLGYLCRSVYNKIKTEVLVSVGHSVTENVIAFSYCSPYQSTILHIKYSQFTASTYVTYPIAVESNLSLFLWNWMSHYSHEHLPLTILIKLCTVVIHVVLLSVLLHCYKKLLLSHMPLLLR